MSKVPFHFSNLHGKVVWTRESSHANPGTDFLLCAGRDYCSCRPRGPVFLLLGLPASAALDVERDGPATDSILALARATSAQLI
jgi:hypothetical protein